MSRNALIDFLVQRRFPLLKAAMATGQLGKGGLAMRKEADVYRAELAALSPNDLNRHYQQEMQGEAEKEWHKTANEEAARFFNQPRASADFEYWGKNAYWTLEEAVALALGLNPELVTVSSMTPYRAISPFAQQYFRLHNLAVRAKGIEQLWDPVYPSIFVNWASDNEIPIPDALRLAVAKGTQLRSWKDIA